MFISCYNAKSSTALLQQHQQQHVPLILLSCIKETSFNTNLFRPEGLFCVHFLKKSENIHEAHLKLHLKLFWYEQLVLTFESVVEIL